MPIYDSSSDPSIPTAPATPITVQPEAHKSVIVDTKRTDRLHLVVGIEGSPWHVTWFSQVLAADSALSPFSPSVPASIHPLKKVHYLELRVTTPLAPEHIAEEGAMTLAGSANMFPGIIPNVGDVFIADIGDGRDGVFQITTVNRKSIYAESTYEIEYSIIDYATQVIRGNLEQKTVEVLYFVRDLMFDNRKPIITAAEYDNRNYLISFYTSWMSIYFRMFVSKNTKLLAVPAQGTNIVYDHFMNKFINTVFGVGEFPEMANMRTLAVRESAAMSVETMLDVIADRSPSLGGWISRDMGLALAVTFSIRARTAGIYHSGVTHVVFPEDAGESANVTENNFGVLSMDTLKLVESYAPATVDVPTGNLVSKVPVITAMHNTQRYIFSNAFYQFFSPYSESRINNDRGGMSILELELTKYLEREPLDMGNISKVIAETSKMPYVEQFYVTPIVALLAKHATKFE